MTLAVKWELHQHGRYEDHVKKYQRDQVVTKALRERLMSLRDAERPERLGDHKIGRLNGVCGAYGAWLSKSVRLLFTVDYTAHAILLLDIGNHKVVYGKD